MNVTKVGVKESRIPCCGKGSCKELLRNTKGMQERLLTSG